MKINSRTRVIAWALGFVSLFVGAPLTGLALVRGTDPPVHREPTQAAAASVTPAPDDAGNDFVGVLLPPRMADLSPRADGKVLEARVKAGQSVREGDIILAFDLRESQEELAIAQAQLNAVRAEAAASAADSAAARKRAARRATSVSLDGKQIELVSREEMSQARAEAESAAAHTRAALAQVEKEEARVNQLRVALEESNLSAPFAGVVSFVNFEAGSRIHVGEVAARVVGGSGLRARIAVPEESPQVLKLPRVRIVADGHVLWGNVAQVTSEPEPASRAFIVEATIDTADIGETVCAELAGKPIRAFFAAR